MTQLRYCMISENIAHDTRSIKVVCIVACSQYVLCCKSILKA